MTNAEKSTLLGQYDTLEQEAARTKTEWAFWKDRAALESDLARRAAAGARAEWYAGRLLQKYEACLDLRERLESMIERAPTLRDQLLLRLHYVDGLSLEATAERMDLSTRHIMRLHQKALDGLLLFGSSSIAA